MGKLRRTLVAPVLFGLLPGCGGSDDQPRTDPASLFDSQICQTCHPSHYQEWSASMHAYASDDPVFMAMNRRGQRETGGSLGDFCIKCHAPVALREGLTHDGLNLDQVPRTHKGVTCYFCHSIDSVTDAHDNPLTLARDGAMRGPIADPVANQFHQSRYSKLLDSSRTDAAGACGSCHDIVNQKGTAIERTFAEWRGSLFASTQVGQGCGGCHLPGREGMPAATSSDRLRRVHDHRMPGVDVALTPWPDLEDQRRAIFEQLGTAAQGALCLDDRSNRIQVVLDNVGAGHMWPSGAASDRRVWVEVVAYANGQVIYQTGVVPDGTAVETVDDPDLWLIRDCFFDDSGHDVHMFWQAARYTSNLLPPSPILVPGVRPMPRGHFRWDLPRPDSTRQLPAVPDRITMRVHIRAIGQEVINDLVAFGDLPAAVAGGIPTFEVSGGAVEWTPEAVNFRYVDRGSVVSCVAPVGFNSTTMPTVSQARCVLPPPGP
jgi:Cytochrome c554 and c-prime